ncbi:MAG: polymer-forming cytoskeletal protein [Gammaproteobacteria bacterium]|nr:polymer-forming cytoskeletal protein [Gammaproteobacteria bacterium]MCP4089681.1 polymer-forming cytoskeletal protein [Gammaproteobacteria bacterium]MCP4276029.1 polymer-forming cytoskeletal protein [Gammaproteobacteria bacterium]MCP4833107.1 polymer-forming cytoskeletal protein [Gammaproteobacteria bacterium]MCP4929625.1 polymer-forming cytoskeletal protein [Gammaproteobacteria bacterium]
MFGNKGRKAVAIQTLIGSNSHIDGDLTFEGGCHIDGVVNGSVLGGNDTEAYLSISEHGQVQGNVTVPVLGLSGAVQGDVIVSERAELGPTARVTGNVHYNQLEIAAGAEINGQLIHGSPAGRKMTAEERSVSADILTDSTMQGAAKQSG